MKFRFFYFHYVRNLTCVKAILYMRKNLSTQNSRVKIKLSSKRNKLHIEYFEIISDYNGWISNVQSNATKRNETTETKNSESNTKTPLASNIERRERKKNKNTVPKQWLQESIAIQGTPWRFILYTYLWFCVSRFFV